ncbi:SCO2521 family protein [Yinghuangia aomiensis]|uniref:SCO2521 family protein n=1 Tax=Yinghuangia aomiensis TaxID=676205 RepID=A0ABP9HUX6_9ACTN
MLAHSTPVTPTGAAELLALPCGRAVRTWTRPIARTVTPATATGVDCGLPADTTGKRVRGIGSMLAHTALTGGRVLQANAFARVTSATTDHRLPWSHYLSHSGTVEAVGRIRATSLAEGFFDAGRTPDTLDPGGIAGHRLAAVQQSPDLDRRPPLKAARTSLRWAIVRGNPENPDRQAEFTVSGTHTRTLLLRAEDLDDVADLLVFSEDIARHDWLLTVLGNLLDHPHESPAYSHRLRMAAEHLAHLWMPASVPTPRTAELWDGFERVPGFTRQWSTMEARVRRTIAARTASMLEHPGRTRSGHRPPGA